MPPSNKDDHRRVDNSAIHPRCSCGWRGEVSDLKGKTTEDMCIDGAKLWQAHVLQFEVESDAERRGQNNG